MRVFSSKKAFALRRSLVAAAALLALAAALLAGCGGAGTGSGGAGTGGGGASSPRSAPQTDAAGPFRFIVCGDPQNNYEVFDRVLAAAESADFLVIAGDLTGSGTTTEFETFTRHMEASGVTYYTVPGNHDVATSPASGNYASFLGAPYRSFDHGNSHFVLIDNSAQETGFDPRQRRWVRDDLEGARARGFEHIFAVAHVPPGYPYSARATAAQIPGIDANRELAPVLERGGVETLFCGHVHTYLEERDGDLDIVITGGAGAPLLRIGGDAYHHYVLVEVNGRRVTRTVVRI